MAGFPNKALRRTQRRPNPGAHARQSAFSKHRSSLASEVSTLCAVETMLVVFAPCGNPVKNRLIYCGKADAESIRSAKAEKEASLCQLEKDYSVVLQKLEAEKIRGEELKMLMVEYQSEGQSLMDRPIDELSMEEMLTLNSMLEGLANNLRKRLQELSPEQAASTSAGENDASLGGSSEGDSYVP